MVGDRHGQGSPGAGVGRLVDRRGQGSLGAGVDRPVDHREDRMGDLPGDQMGGRPEDQMGATMEEDLQPMGEQHRARPMEANRVVDQRDDHQGAYHPGDRMGDLLEDLMDGRPEDPLASILGSTTTTKDSELGA